MTDEHISEMTYAAKKQGGSTAVVTENLQHIVSGGAHPTDRSAEIYSFATMIAERTHEARIEEMNAANKEMVKA